MSNRKENEVKNASKDKVFNKLDDKKISEFTREELESCTNEYLSTRIEEIREWAKDIQIRMDKAQAEAKLQIEEANKKLKEMYDFKEQQKAKSQKEEETFTFDDFVH